jgi:hypothetical protein
MAKKLTKKQMEAVYEAVVKFLIEKTGEDEAYVRENSWLRPQYVWSGSPYDAINSEGLMYEWVHYACNDDKVSAVAAKHKVFLEPYTSWSLGMYPEWS